ncbi:hypothetical protein [Mucilaginibacter arboris]|uniref:Phosphatidate cytidylyltransferase n=1 Tax=Mucilaginibacter arboris TaxID=2682090 RepID=A0A7K1SZ28_9SPHI|nr:hypothetical protein [Mucilaginibacter arboris]MVN22584.1 hypothetical protein [Mucilaginibacter arboris]
MKKWFLFGLFSLTTTFQSCMVVGGVFRAGFKMGIYSVLIFVGLIVWVISKRSNRR